MILARKLAIVSRLTMLETGVVNHDLLPSFLLEPSSRINQASNSRVAPLKFRTLSLSPPHLDRTPLLLWRCR